MFKKLLKIGMLVSLIAVACTANAQEQKQYKLEYPKYGFWSNWSLGGAVGYNWEFEHGGIADFKDATNIGFRLFLEKELNHVFNTRLIADLPGIIDGNYDSFFKLGLDVKISFQGLFKGYDPDRRGNLYLFAGGGFWNHRDDVPEGLWGVYMQGGLGWSYKLSDKFTFFVELGDDICSDVAELTEFFDWHDNNGWVYLGGMFNFGSTQADQDLIAQRAMLTQENFDRMANEIDGLRNDLKAAKEKEAKLINRINDLEDQIAHMQPVKVDDGTADSLRRVIEGYENNKHNFYAMPFSILYDVDSYVVREDQMNKINAIAQIMKDDESINYEIIGYCDYSGSDEYNQKLSEKRAERVKKLLVRKGVDEDRLTVSGKGKTTPFGNIRNSVNRRVSFYRVNK